MVRASRLHRIHNGGCAALPEMQTLFSQKKLAILANVGTLLQPTTKAQYAAGPPNSATEADTARCVPRPLVTCMF